MIVYSILFITLFIALLVLWLLACPRHWSRWVLAGSLALFIHFYGGWVFLSFYTKYLFDVAVVVAFCCGILRNNKINSRTAGWKIISNLVAA